LVGVVERKCSKGLWEVVVLVRREREEEVRIWVGVLVVERGDGAGKGA
jgi:hypothetical protein